MRYGSPGPKGKDVGLLPWVGFDGDAKKEMRGEMRKRWDGGGEWLVSGERWEKGG
jgi:hypothetical protein